MLFDKREQLGLFNNQPEKRYNSLAELKDIAVACHRCDLRDNCTQVVFGTGNKNADLMFVGEGPGKEEDQQGVPFVGRAGQLLDKILDAAEISKDEVYISNIVKCRPPSN
ncbi:MAG: uracil-DNA glycosylase, partial [Bacillota bacterium]